MKYEAHELASVFPMLSEDELQGLATDIRVNGQREAIILLEGKILDGRNRFKACEIAGVKPITEEFTGNDPVAFVASLNIHRRHLTSSQRAMAVASLVTLKLGDNQHKGEGAQKCAPSVSQSDAAKIGNVSRRSVQQAAKVKKKGVVKLQDLVTAGKVSVEMAARFSEKPKIEQDLMLRQTPQSGQRVIDWCKQSASKSPLGKAPVESKPEASVSTPSGKPPRLLPASSSRPIFLNQGIHCWVVARESLDRIAESDIHREEALKACIEYCIDGLTKAKRPPAKPKPSSAGKIPEYIPGDGLLITAAAIGCIDKILPNDTHRVGGLRKIIDYCLARLEKKR